MAIGNISGQFPDVPTCDTFHTVCKVVDYTPDNLESFAFFGRGVNDDDRTPEKWVWRFILEVEGIDGNTMPLLVEGEDDE